MSDSSAVAFKSTSTKWSQVKPVDKKNWALGSRLKVKRV